MAFLSVEEMCNLAAPRQPAVVPCLRPCVLTGEAFGRLAFVHHMTHHFREIDGVSAGASPGYAQAGSTLWVARAPNGQCVALSFDFQSCLPGVLVLANLLNVASNAVIVSPRGSNGESHMAEVPHLTAFVSAVHRLRWQEVVAEHAAMTGAAG